MCYALSMKDEASDGSSRAAANEVQDASHMRLLCPPMATEVSYFQNSHHFFAAFGAAGIACIGSGIAAAPTYFDGSASNASLHPTAQK